MQVLPEICIKKIVSSLEKVQRDAAHFLSQEFNQTASVTDMIKEKKCELNKPVLTSSFKGMA